MRKSNPSHTESQQSLTSQSSQADADAWLAAIVESSDDAIIGKTLDSTIRSWNAAATRIFHYEPGEIIGHSVLTLIPPELQYEEAAIVARLSRGERIDHFETVRVCREGTRIEVSLSVSPIKDKSGRVVGAAKIARDITEQNRLRRAERELVDQLQNTASELELQIEESQSLQEELEQTNYDLGRALADEERARRDAEIARRLADEANAAKSHFLATMSHELRTPLNAIAGYVDLLELGVRGPVTADQRLDLVRIKRSQKALLRLVEDVLNFAKIEAGRLEYHYEAVRVGELLDGLETFIAPKLREKGLSYSLDPCEVEVVITIDRAKVEQILLNLLSNAIKFTDAGSVHLSCHSDDSLVRFHVRDTGRGIPTEDLDTIFEPFVQGETTLAKRMEGTGLGLSISRKLARDMGGDVFVQSTIGEGSTFTVVLPRR